MTKLLRHLGRGEKGFTLVELVVVIAILGVLAAIATPLVVNFLGQSKVEAYKAETDVIQAAVEGYFADPANVRFLGQRTYPIVGKGETDLVGHSQVTVATTAIEDDLTSKLGDPDGAGGIGGAGVGLPFWNPLGGQIGADLATTPKWADTNTDGLRNATEAAPVLTLDKWSSVTVIRNLISYQVDPRYYFIDMEALVSPGKFMDAPAKSAASENCPTTPANCKGSYIWYVDNNGRVQSLLKAFPKTKGYADVFP